MQPVTWYLCTCIFAGTCLIKAKTMARYLVELGKWAEEMTEVVTRGAPHVSAQIREGNKATSASRFTHHASRAT